MKAAEAKNIARRWVEEEAAELPGFAGAWLMGSLNWLPDEAELSPTTDADMQLSFEDEASRERTEATLPHKFLRDGLILEVGCGLLRAVSDSDEVLGNLFACAFAAPNVLSDPTGTLERVHKAVAPEYAKLRWVLKRCEHVRGVFIPHHLKSMLSGPGLPQQIHEFLWLVICNAFIIHMSDLKLPTLRKALLSTNEILARYNKLDFQVVLLKFLGCHQATPTFAQQQLEDLRRVFPRAVELKQTPFPIHRAISAVNEPIAVGGCQEIIDAGYHRESLLWILAMRTHCQWVFENDAEEEERLEHRQTYLQTLEDFGFCTPVDASTRKEEAEDLVAQTMELAKEIAGVSPSVMR